MPLLEVHPVKDTATRTALIRNLTSRLFWRVCSCRVRPNIDRGRGSAASFAANQTNSAARQVAE